MFRDLIGKLDAVRVTCQSCGRDGLWQPFFFAGRSADGHRRRSARVRPHFF